MSDCFVLYLLLTCMKKKTSGADKFTNNTPLRTIRHPHRINSTLLQESRTLKPWSESYLAVETPAGRRKKQQVENRDSYHKP